ncbi:MAG: hypothetical protein LQ345_003209 [Seirophora villosa]|nr:MAG: hypothetical protein LQ345_003209 [Seirophora villosa]
MARNDVYLSLCLEQAALSPLHYRHGCIVVRGGKVIGKGYNDYRSGFNGGAQSTGRLSSAGASNALRAKKLGRRGSMMAKKSAEQLTKEPKQPEGSIAFDGRDHSTGGGGGALSNTPLSMHSEMMAINSALSLSSAIACQGTARSTQWLQKPCFKLSGPSKQRARLQHLKAYADAICRVSEEQTTATEHRGGSHSEDYSVEEEEEEEKEKMNLSKRRNLANNNVHHHGQPDHLNTHKTNSWKARQPTSDNSEKHRKQYLYGLSDGIPYRHHGRHEETHNLTHQHQQQEQQHRSSAVVMPQHRILTKSHQTAERMKDSRLNGADLYVARLGKRGKADHFDCGCRHDRSSRVDDRPVVEKGSEQQSTDLESSAKISPLTGSLHEELRFPLPKEKSEQLPRSMVKEEHLTATHSKPCYRCISYMHSAGIKRVFWTNKDGQWECGKVRDLIDALEGPASPSATGRGAAPVAGSVYVTKSEVLLLKGLK